MSERPLLIDPLLWMALGFGVADDRFARMLCHNVFPEVFGDDLKRQAYYVVEAGGKEAAAKLMALLGVRMKPGERLSQSIIRVLGKESEGSVKGRMGNSDCRVTWATAEKEVRAIHEATARLLQMARADDWRQVSEVRWQQEQAWKREGEKVLMDALNREAK